MHSRTPRRATVCAAVLLVGVVVAPPLEPQQLLSAASREVLPANLVTLHYGVEWRLVRAGNARLTYNPTTDKGWQGNLKLESTGLVAKLYKVDDDYRAYLDPELCTLSTLMVAHEGRRRRETKVTYDAGQKKASYLERDLIKNALVNQRETDIPGCVHDVVGGLLKLRTSKLEPGQSAQLPMSDGKKFVQVKVEAQEREEVKTPLGKFSTIRYEVFLFNGVLYGRKGRMFVWISDDERRLPVQLRARMQFHVGTLTFQLEKEDRT